MSIMKVNHAPYAGNIVKLTRLRGKNTAPDDTGRRKSVLSVSRISAGASIKIERTSGTDYCFGNMDQSYTVDRDWTYVDLVNHTVTRTVAKGVGVNRSDSQSGTRVSAFAGVTASITSGIGRKTGAVDVRA